MVQYGWNAGPHNAHIFGLVRNIKVKLSGEEHEGHDRKILGTFALSWNFLTSALDLRRSLNQPMMPLLQLAYL